MIENPEVEGAITNLITRIADEFPVLRAILDSAKMKEIDEQEAMALMMAEVTKDPAISDRLQEVAMTEFAPLRDPTSLRKVDTHGGAIMDRGRGLPRLNPLLEASLIERAQFDGDMPELRTGPLPAGVMPAVSVQTAAKNPAMIGLMLNTASQQIQGDVAAADADRLKLVESITGGDTAALIAKVGKGLKLVNTQDAIDRVLSGKHPIVDATSYQRGRVPAPVAVQAPTGSDLALMSEADRRTYAWKFLSTTQGRRSAVATIEKMLVDLLTKDGFAVTARPFSIRHDETIVAAHEWTVSIDGAGSTQASFNVIDTSGRSIHAHLKREMGERRGAIILEVTALNTVSDREVGWAGRLLSGDRALPAPG